MKKIHSVVIQKTVAELCVKANTQLRGDVLTALKSAYQNEDNIKAKDALGAIIKNAAIAKKRSLAICQDTGLPYIFVELGSKVEVKGDIKRAINNGVELGYREGFLRTSVIGNPLFRKTPGYKPSIIHFDLVESDSLKLTVLPKGFGSENKSRLKMFLPTDGIDKIKQFIVDSVRDAGADACPPYIVGVGIGGTADYAGFLAKKALLKKITDKRSKVKNYISGIEQDILVRINKLGIGPMGLGGGMTCLGVNIETFATHIAGLPVAVNISCHALRSAVKRL